LFVTNARRQGIKLETGQLPDLCPGGESLSAASAAFLWKLL
jgi:hypothetical protein